MQELRGRARELGIRGRSKMKRRELEEAIVAAENEVWYKENVQCKDCLREQFRQKQIDKEVYDKRLMKQVIRDLCKWCDCGKLAYDGDLRVCIKCGCLQQERISTEGGYEHHRVRWK